MTGSELYILAKSGANVSITLPLTELLQLVEEADNRATARAQTTAQRTPERMWTIEEFCNFWRITDRTLRNWEKNKVVRLTRTGGQTLIDPEEQNRLRATRKV